MLQRFLCAIVLAAAPLITLAQDFSAYRDYAFKQPSDYKDLQPKVLDMANYILQVPVDGANVNRLIATQVMIKWMSGTPDYEFSLDKSLEGVAKKNDEIMVLYMAAATKYQLETETKAGSSADARLNAFRMMLEYCEKESNGIRKNKELQKAIDAKNKGELKRYLKI